MNKVKILTVLLLITLVSNVHGQETKLKKEKDNGLKAEYYVLKSDKSTKHGLYKKYDRSGELIIEGQYENDKEIGEWKFLRNGEIEQVYDFSKNELISYNQDMSYEILEGSRFTEGLLDKPPYFVGGQVRLTEKLNEVISYPMRALALGVEGKMFVYVTIGPENNLLDVTVAKGIEEFNSEVINGLKKINFDWISGVKDGQTVTTRFIVPVWFRLYSNGDKTITVE
ncbi:energy transducer TonB [Fulvivirga ligni]|uniref:energy transducer TonB n=1 Tax=Fulvivirga ligni TaxID=2904246 RepID=UPI001F464CC6|nr:energy transducer TonB [Fulvivirga ligni]UII20729.1 energy transducer TonB [Fulvivirga ligni]